MFEGLDFVLAESQRRGLLVLLTLTNYWTDYGGMTQVTRHIASGLSRLPYRGIPSMPTLLHLRTLLPSKHLSLTHRVPLLARFLCVLRRHDACAEVFVHAMAAAGRPDGE